MNRKIRIGRTTCGNRCPAILARTACSMIARLLEASLSKRTKSGHGFWRARLCWRWASSRGGDKFATESLHAGKSKIVRPPDPPDAHRVPSRCPRHVAVLRYRVSDYKASRLRDDRVLD